MQIPSLINKLFEKRGIKKLTELSPEEKRQYDNWQAIIDGTEVSVEKIKDFCQSQVKLIEERFSDPESTERKDTFAKASLHIYLNLLKLINSPEDERRDLEKYLTDLINK